mmetsp:Transcript_28686/g.61174  ORF Transcript_28686/g.61174 Transcript_28686/m.61174 type:complete len:211 (+) Transcript_28686:139-771(+)
MTLSSRDWFTQLLPLAAFLFATITASHVPSVSASRFEVPAAFTLTMMGSRRGKGGNLKRSLDESGLGGASSVRGVNSGRGQEITGVTLPKEGEIRGWAFGADRSVACANVGGKYFAVEGACPRCAFDLYKGKLLVDEDVWGPEPCVACPTCSVTYSLKTGKFGPEYKAKGLAGFVNTWAKTATIGKESRPVPAFIISTDEDDGRVYCREL